MFMGRKKNTHWVLLRHTFQLTIQTLYKNTIQTPDVYLFWIVDFVSDGYRFTLNVCKWFSIFNLSRTNYECKILRDAVRKLWNPKEMCSVLLWTKYILVLSSFYHDLITLRIYKLQREKLKKVIAVIYFR